VFAGEIDQRQLD